MTPIVAYATETVPQYTSGFPSLLGLEKFAGGAEGGASSNELGRDLCNVRFRQGPSVASRAILFS